MLTQVVVEGRIVRFFLGDYEKSKAGIFKVLKRKFIYFGNKYDAKNFRVLFFRHVLNEII